MNSEIENLQFAIKVGSEHEVQRLLCEVSENNKIRAYRACLEEQKPYLKETVAALVPSLSNNAIILEFDFLMNLQASYKDATRAYSKNLLKRLSSKDLGHKIEKLFFYMDSPCSLIRYLAEELLFSIEAKDLKFSYLEKTYLFGHGNTFDVAWSLQIKAIKSWDIADLRENFQYLVDLQSSTDKELRNLGFLGALRVMETWPVLNLSKQLSFLINCNQSEDDSIFELAAKLALKVLIDYEREDCRPYLEYLITLQRSAIKKTLRVSQDLALSILMDASEEVLFEKRALLLTCQDSRRSLIRRKAVILFQKIPAQFFTDYTEELIAYFKNGRPNVREEVQRILFKLDSAKFAQVLDKLLEAQRSIDEDFRKLNADLALRIGERHLAEKKDYLEEMRWSRLLNVAQLAQALYAKV